MLENQRIRILKGLIFSNYAVIGFSQVLFPLYFSYKGFSNVHIGLFMSIGAFVSVFAQPFWGYLSDRFQTIKKTVFLLWAMTILSSIGLFLSNGFWPTLLFMLLLYFFQFPTVPLLDSAAIKASAKVGAAYGSIRWWGSFGYAVMAVISGYAVAWIGGIEYIGYLFAVILFIPLLLLFFYRDEDKHAASLINVRMLTDTLRNRSLMFFLIMTFLVTISHRMNDSLFGIYLSDMGAGSAIIGWSWTIVMLAQIPFFLVVARLAKAFHELAIFGCVSLLFTMTWLAYAYFHNPEILMFMQAFDGISIAIYLGVGVQYIAKIVPAELLTTSQAMFSAVFQGLAGIAGGAAGGWIYEEWSGSAMYYSGAVLTLLCGCVFAIAYMTARSGKKWRSKRVYV